jgi:hypothetical protein
MAYELFQNKAAKFGSPQLTIRGGRISFNADAGDILSSAGMRFAHILWDAHAYKLALKPITKEDENAFRVSVPAGKRGGTFSAQSFLNFIHWNATEPIVVAAEWNERERLLEARLPKENIGVGEKGRVVKRRAKGIS